MADSEIPAEPNLRNRQQSEDAYGEPEELANRVRRRIDAIVSRQSQRKAHENKPQRGIGVDLGHESERPDHRGREYGPTQQRGQTGDDSKEAGAPCKRIRRTVQSAERDA